MGPTRVLASAFLFLGVFLGLGGAAAAQAGAAGGAIQSADALTLRPGDALRITVWPTEGLSGEFPIEDTGSIYLPLLGEIRAAGVPLGQLRTQLRAGYRETQQNPVVTIIPVFSVGVIGAVRSPGIYRVTPSQGLFDIIGGAGGFNANADQERVQIVREGEVVEVDALQALEEGRGLTATQIRPGDQIVVPLRSDITFRDVLSVVQTAVTIGLLVERVIR
jgi:polysaccharide export outer membrane protein